MKLIFFSFLFSSFFGFGSDRRASGTFPLQVLLVVVVALTPYLFLKGFRSNLNPTNTMIVQETEFLERKEEAETEAGAGSSASSSSKAKHNKGGEKTNRVSHENDGNQDDQQGAEQAVEQVGRARKRGDGSIRYDGGGSGLLWRGSFIF